MKKLMFIALATVTLMFTSCWTDKNSDNEKKTDGTEMNDSNVIIDDLDPGEWHFILNGVDTLVMIMEEPDE